MRRVKIGAVILQTVAVIYALMALFIGLANQSPLFRSIFEGDLIAGSLGAAHRAAAIGPFKAYVYGVLGGSLFGFAASVFSIARFGIARREKWAWWTVLAASILWYALDTGGSIRTGVLLNAAGNTLFLAVILAALALSARACLAKGADAGTA
jgi:hypothetical protein